jgi:ribosomal protein L2
MKPDVLKQIVEMEESRKRNANARRNEEGRITVQKPGESPKSLTHDETVDLLRKQQDHIGQLTTELHKRDAEIARLTKVINKAFEKFKVAEPGEIDVNDLITQINS